MIIDFIYSIMKKEDRNTSDYHKIKVTYNGGFYMESKDIFENKEKSLNLLRKLERSLNAYNKKHLENSL